jgi:glycerophosphoryl diester phosphodiesterase
MFNTDQEVSDLSFSELSKLGVDSLSSALNDPKCCPCLNIELKSNNAVQDRLERLVSEVIKNSRAERRIYFSSFNPFSLWRMAQYLPHVPRALLVSDEPTPENNLFLRKKLLAPLIPLHALHLKESMITEEALKKYSMQRIPVAVWTVNSVDQALKYFRWGAWSVITDKVPTQ